MPRSAVTLALALVLAACGSNFPSGTVLGQSLDPQDAIAVVGSSATCRQFPANYGVSALVVVFSSFGSLCSATGQPCMGRSNETEFSLVIFRASPGTAQPIGAGTYPVTPANPAPDSTGTILAVTANGLRTDNHCNQTKTAEGSASGSVRIDDVTSGRVKGHVDVRFTDGGHFEGDFDAPNCTAAIDFCTGAPPSCTGTPVCQP